MRPPNKRATPADSRALSPEETEFVQAVLAAYGEGWFPMYDPDGERLQWVQPHRRALIPLEPDRFKPSRSLRAVVRSGRFALTTDTAFPRVIRACARPAKGRESTWLNEDVIAMYEFMHRAGHAHSIEAWLPAAQGSGRARPVLVGGLYGLALGSVFCGESMFSRPDLGGDNASKVCLVALVEHLRERGFTMLDAQLSNPHLEQFGLYEVDREMYLGRLAEGKDQHREWLPFQGPTSARDQVG